MADVPIAAKAKVRRRTWPARICKNPTERSLSERRSQRDLRRQKSQRDTAIESMLQGLCMFDAEGRIVFCNDQYAKIMEFSKRTLKGKSLLNLFKARKSAGQFTGNPEDVFAIVMAKVGTGKRTSEVIETPKGQIFRVSRNPIPGGGWVATYEDITEAMTNSRMAEAQKRVLFSSIDACPVCITIADAMQPDFPLIYANRKFLEVTGYDNDEIIGRNCRFLQGSATDRRVVDDLRQAIVAGKRAEVRFINYRKDGSEFLNHLVVVPVHDDAGRIVASIGFQNDVTDDAHHQAEVQRQKMEALGRMVGGVAHEINNMLQPIMLLGRDIIDNGEAGNEEKQQLEIMLDCSGKARKIIGDLLAFSRPPTKKLDVCDPVALLKDGLGLIRKAIPQDVVLATRIDNCLPKISVDPTAFVQILLNLATNAAAAMDGRGELTIVLDAEQRGTAAADLPKTMGFARLRVSDTGCGMTKEALDRAFEPFFTTKPVGQGTGLGLSVVYGLVREMGGTITLDSEVGRGTTVTILMPGHRHSSCAVVHEDFVAGQHQERDF
jgi:PAS domain S-box-containing protein